MNPKDIENPIAESDFRAQALREREKAYLENGLEYIRKIKDRISVELYTTICKTDYDDGIAQGYRNVLRILDKEFMKSKKITIADAYLNAIFLNYSDEEKRWNEVRVKQIDPVSVDVVNVDENSDEYMCVFTISDAELKNVNNCKKL